MELALAWTEEEQAAYTCADFGSEARRFDQAGKAPTALHSWGCALRACPCGCRTQGFCRDRLRRQGLRGVGVFSTVLGRVRFPHAAEVALLNTVPPLFAHLADPRAALCLVGQLAAPLQALWVTATVKSWAERAFHGTSQTDPLALVQHYKQYLLQQRKDAWLVPSLQQGGMLELQQSGQLLRIRTEGPVQVHHLLAAESHLQGSCGLTLHRNGQPLLPSTYLHFGPQEVAYVLSSPPEVSGQAPAQSLCVSPVSAAPLPSTPRGGAASSQDVDTILQAEGRCSDVALWHGLQQIIAGHVDKVVLLFPPMAFSDVLHSLRSVSRLDDVSHWTFIPFLSDGHWSLLAFQRVGQGATIPWLFDGIPGRSLCSANELVIEWILTHSQAIRPLQEVAFWHQTAQLSCGALVMAHVAAVLEGGVRQQQCDQAEAFLRHFPAVATPFVGTGGLSDDQQTELVTLLTTHGVPAEVVSDRVKAAITKVGAGAIAAALRSKNTWQALKVAASKPDCRFMWVHPTELQAHIEARGTQKFGLTVRNPRQKKQKGPPKRPVQAPLHVDPAQLQLASGSFTTTDGLPLGQLAFAEVAAQATGICFITAQQAAPFLAGGKHLSVEALGLLTTAELPADLQTALEVKALRFPAIYSPTQEAILVTGSLLQLGDVRVCLAQDDIADLEPIHTGVCRLNIYRDEFGGSWEAVAAAPVKTLLSLAPSLALCVDPACKGDCVRYHNAVDETVEQLLLDVWGRSFQRLEGGKVDALEASVFQAYIRVPSSAVGHLVRQQIPGVYLEPRATDGTGPHPSWVVVWLPGASAAEAQHALKMSAKALSLARLGRKYGLRAKEQDEQLLFEEHRPQHQYVKVRVVSRFHLHPLPHGLQRQGLLTLLRKWNWLAKPLQPERGDSQGSAWLVGAEGDPPALTLPLGDSYVLITKAKDSGAMRATGHTVCASARTKRHILLDDPVLDPPVDPWQGGRDPWSLAAPSENRQSAVPSAQSVSKWGQLETELKQDVQNLVQQAVAANHTATASSSSGQGHRLCQLESGVQELRMQNQKFENWFQTFGQQVTDQSKSLTTLQQSVQRQQQELSQVRTEVTQAVTAVHTDVSQQLTTQLATQMERIQELFAEKKARVL